MPRFIIRVELPGRPNADYRALHREMRAEQYRRVIQGVNGWHHLPHAEYTISLDWTCEQIREDVYATAKRHHPKARVFVSQIETWCAKWLRPVTEADPDVDD